MGCTNLIQRKNPGDVNHNLLLPKTNSSVTNLTHTQVTAALTKHPETQVCAGCIHQEALSCFLSLLATPQPRPCRSQLLWLQQDEALGLLGFVSPLLFQKIPTHKNFSGELSYPINSGTAADSSLGWKQVSMEPFGDSFSFSLFVCRIKTTSGLAVFMAHLHCLEKNSS